MQPSYPTYLKCIVMIQNDTAQKTLFLRKAVKTAFSVIIVLIGVNIISLYAKGCMI